MLRNKIKSFRKDLPCGSFFDLKLFGYLNKLLSRGNAEL